MQRYSEAELISNRSGVLLFGGTATERRAWTEEAARHFDQEGELVWVKTPRELLSALARHGGVVGVEDVSGLDHAAQGQILNCLLRQEERPKLVLGLRMAADAARAHGLLREDLHYRLDVARVDLSAEEIKAAIRARAAKRAAKAPGPTSKPASAKPAVPAAKPSTATMKRSAKPAASAKRAPKPAAKSAPRAAPAPRKASAKPALKAKAKAAKPAGKKKTASRR